MMTCQVALTMFVFLKMSLYFLISWVVSVGLASRWIYLNDQNLCIPASSSFVYGAVPIGASIYVIGDLDTGENTALVSWKLLPEAQVHQLSSAPSLGLGTNYDYVREFKRSTGTWHHTKPLLPSDLRRTGCAALRIANCKLFRLQLQQGLFRIRVHSPWRGRGAKSEILPQAHHVAGCQQAQRSSSISLCAGLQ